MTDLNRRKLSATGLLWCLIWLLLAGCVDDTTDTDGPCGADGGAAGWTTPEGVDELLAVVGTDFQTTEVSIIDRANMKVVSAAFLHSGTRVTCSGTALGGDVVLGRRPAGDGSFWLIDRASGVLTHVSDEGVLGQVKTAGGWLANPQDAIGDGKGGLWVSRAQRDVKAPADAPRGDDLVHVNASSGEIDHRIGLSEHASLADAHAWPGRMTMAGGKLVVPLASVATDFGQMGQGSVAIVDPVVRKVNQVLTVAAAKNCTAARSAGKRVAVVCSGFYKEPDGKRYTFSKILDLAVGATATTASVAAHASDTGTTRGFGFDLALDGDGRGWVITDGDLTAGVPDALWQFDLKGGKPIKIADASGPFAMTSLWLDVDRRRLWVTDRGAKDGDLLIFDMAGHGVAEPIATLDSNPNGLRAAELVGF